MFCYYCGKPNSDDALFCRECGKKIEHATSAPQEPVASTNPAELTHPSGAAAAAAVAEAEPVRMQATAAQVTTAAPPQGVKKWTTGRIVGLVIGIIVFVIAPIAIAINTEIQRDRARSGDSSSSSSASSSSSGSTAGQGTPGGGAESGVSGGGAPEAPPAALTEATILGTWKATTSLGDNTLELSADGHYHRKTAFEDESGRWIFNPGNGSLRLEAEGSFAEPAMWRLEAAGASSMNVTDPGGASTIYIRE